MSQRIAAIENLRGLAMLGVIGIHAGACSLSNPEADLHLFALLEICSRFSVPVFFFITAFGIFYQRGSTAQAAATFPTSRIRAVLIPYLFWSLLYMISYSLRFDDDTLWQTPIIWEFLLFGLASYQLYFLVILLIFLICTPLLRRLALWMAKQPVPRLTILLLLQIAFNYYSSYVLNPTYFDTPWLALLIQHRMSYWPLHYLWIYLLGAVFALHYQDATAAMKQHRAKVSTFFWGTLALMLGSYYGSILIYGYSLERAAYTIHQLSPMGVLYTGSAALYLSLLFSQPLPLFTYRLLSTLANHSFFIFLVHPFVMTGLQEVMAVYAIVMTVPVTLLFYVLTVSISFLLADGFQYFSQKLPIASLALLGKHLRNRNNSLKS